MNLEQIGKIIDDVRKEVGRAIVGQEKMLDHLLTALFCGGHVLLEGAPGTGKTFLVQSFAACLGLEFGRIQFTPDMMPGDILGTNLFNFQTNEFTLTPGAIFTQILLADEINRTPPKTQAALLQAMNERLVTIDRKTYSLGDTFMVVATQNPIEQQGTYPLPEAQLDRFLFKLVIDYPSRDEERDIVRLHGCFSAMPKISDFKISTLFSSADILAAQALVNTIRMTEPLIDYVVDIIRATRANPAIETGASSRAANMLAAAARGFAAVKGRDFVIPDDIKDLALPLLRHRVVMTPASNIEGVSCDAVLRSVIESIAAPR